MTTERKLPINLNGNAHFFVGRHPSIYTFHFQNKETVHQVTNSSIQDTAETTTKRHDSTKTLTTVH